MLTDLPGVAVGHTTHAAARTGCTVVLFPEGTVASGEVRGGAPGTREFALLAPERTVARVDAVVLSGGSAFGLAACDGVVRWCEEQGRGFRTGAGIVPIVVGMVLFDLAVGDGSVRPTAEDGYAACIAATAATAANATGVHPAGTSAVGAVGAGTGATVAKWRGPGQARAAGLGTATVRSGDVVVSALIAVNAYGDVVGPGAALPAEQAATLLHRPGPDEAAPTTTENTTIGVVATNVRLDKVGCQLVAQSAHDGFARALWPVHTTADGDAVVAASVPAPEGGVAVEAPVDLVRMLAVEATARAILAAAGA